MKHYSNLIAIVVLALILQSCATTSQTIPSLQFTQYGLEPGPEQTQKQSDIQITLTSILTSDIYEYPDLFAFNLENFPQYYQDNFYLKNNYPPDSRGYRWASFFSSPDASESLLVCWVTLENNTDHILRMSDSRVYLVIDGQEPIPAFEILEYLISQAEKYEAIERQRWNSKVLKVGEFPSGFARAFITSKQEHYRLINDVSKEILPGFTYEGMLVFPAVSNTSRSAQISFFDITTKTDAAGNPTEKTRFDFTLEPQNVQMWYDKEASRWKKGTPPTQSMQ